MSKIKIHTRFTVPADAGTVNQEESLTDQSYREVCDIYYHMLDKTPAMLASTGQLGEYGVDTRLHFTDYQDIKAGLERQWLHLSPEQKEKFKGPQEFLKYCSNPENYLEFEGTLMLKNDAYKIMAAREKEELETLRAEKKTKKKKINVEEEE